MSRTGPIGAAIDIGSNSIKLRMGRLVDGKVEVLLDATEVVQLGRGLVDGQFTQEAMDRALAVVSSMADQARRAGARTRLVGTMALRVAANAEEFTRRVLGATGLRVQILSGEEEARYSWRGAASLLPTGGDLVMFDTGGGSTEFVLAQGGRIVRVQSLPVGAVSLTEDFLGFGPVPQRALDAACSHVDALLREHDIRRLGPGAPSVVGLGGGVVAMASVKTGREAFLPQDLHGMTLTVQDLKTQIRLYSLLNPEERQNVVGLPPSRSDVVLGSACIVLRALAALEVPSCVLSIYGLRHGVLMAMLEDGEYDNIPQGGLFQHDRAQDL